MIAANPIASNTATGSQVNRMVSRIPRIRPSTQVPGGGPAGWAVF